MRYTGFRDRVGDWFMEFAFWTALFCFGFLLLVTVRLWLGAMFS